MDRNDPEMPEPPDPLPDEMTHDRRSLIEESVDTPQAPVPAPPAPPGTLPPEGGDGFRARREGFPDDGSSGSPLSLDRTNELLELLVVEVQDFKERVLEIIDPGG